jgi:hypothetical protein
MGLLYNQFAKPFLQNQSGLFDILVVFCSSFTKLMKRTSLARSAGRWCDATSGTAPKHYKASGRMMNS